MVEAYRAKAGSDYGLERIDGSGVKLRELSGMLQATPFLASSRLVLIEGLAGNRTAGGGLTELLKSVSSTTVAVFIETEVDQRTAAFKALNGADKVVKFEPLAPARLLGWCHDLVKQLGGQADREALQELLALAGEDQWRLSQELNKLVNYDETVTVETVRRLVTPSVDQSVFELVEAMTAGRTDAALGAYRRLLAAQENELYLLTMVQWQLRNLLLAKVAPQLTQAELAKEAGMSPYVAGKMMAAQRRHDESVLRAAYRAAADCELDIKSGRLKPEAAVERLIYQVTSGGLEAA